MFPPHVVLNIVNLALAITTISVMVPHYDILPFAVFSS